jgi:hypothetical protein
MAAVLHAAPSRAPLGFADGQLEAIKWLALASMFTDHIGRHLLGWPQDSWVFAVGRLAFPCFAFVLGVNLARTGDREHRAGRTALRLLGWGAVSIAPSVWARGDPQVLNVLVTLGLGAALCWAVEGTAHWLWRMLATLAIAAAAWFAEFGVGGVFLVPAVYLACAHRHAGFAVVALLLAVATAALNAQFGGPPAFAATLACLPLVALVRALPVAMPRWQLFFYLLYPAHLALIGALKSMQ